MFQPLPFFGAVRKLVLANVIIWVFFGLILEGIFKIPINYIFGLSTYNVFSNYLIFEPVTYMFLHSSSPFHILFNMLMLWFFGAELERVWGRKFFTLYFFVCGIGAAIFYLIFKTVIFLLLDKNPVDTTVVIGSSGAIFGLMLAYGILFSERVVYFMMMFPMKVKWMVMIVAGISFVFLIQSGIDSGGVSNLSHLGGIVAGYIFLISWTRYHSKVR